MLNRSGVLSVMDRGVTLNWDDGATLHRMTAQVHYHTDYTPTPQVVIVQAAQPKEDEPLSFVEEDVVRATWDWQGMSLDPANAGATDYWTLQLTVANSSEDDVYIDTLDVLLIDSHHSGQFNLGAPPGLWRCARQNPDGTLAWEPWSETVAGAGGFSRTHELLVQPTFSNRSWPPAVIIRAYPVTPEGDPAAEVPSQPTELKLAINGERFDHLVARTNAGGTRLQKDETLISPRFLVASGDDAVELQRLADLTGLRR